MLPRRMVLAYLRSVVRATRGHDSIPSLVERLESRALMSAGAHTAGNVGITSLTAPSDLGTTVNSPTSVALNWTDNDSNAAGYYVLRSINGINYTTIARLSGVALATYTDNAAPSYKNLDYEIEAFNGAIISSPAGPASAVTAMAPPVSLTARATGPAAVTLAWVNKEPAATGYYILRSSGGGSFSQIAQVTSVKTLTYADKTVSSDTAYSYEVEAYHGSDTSAASNTAAVTTPLVASSGLSGSATSGTDIQISWTGNDDSATGYSVLRATDGKHFTLLSSVDSDSTSYDDSTVVSGHWYYYEIQATDGSVTSAVTTALAVGTPLAAPSGLSTTVGGPTTITLNWTDNDSNAGGYQVLRSVDGTTYATVAKLTGSLLATYADKVAPSFKHLYYKVEAVAGTIVSSPTDAKDATTPMAPPISLTAKATGATTIALAWTNKEPGATGYDILRSTGGGSYSQVGQTTSIKTITFVDNTVSSDTAYSYEVEAVNGENSSGVSASVAVTTPLISPSGLSGSATSGTNIQISWTGNDDNAAGYHVLRSVNGKTFTLLASTTSDTLSYSDSAVISGRSYYYAIQAYNGSIVSAASTALVVNTPLAAPSGLSTTVNGPTSVTLGWTDNDTDATGYVILRSTDGTTFATLAKVSGATAHAFTDAAAVPGHNLKYKVEASAGTIISTPTDASTATTPLATPATLTVKAVGGWASLNWVDKDTTATGYLVFRSTDGVSYSQLAEIDTPTANSYVDNTVTVEQAYYYQVEAFSTVSSSAKSTAVNITVPQGDPSGVSIITRFGDELVITASGASDSISLQESDDTLSILADGQTYTDPVPDAGVFVYTRGGTDSISIDSSVSARTTVETIDNATTLIDSSGSDVSAWVDSTDTYTGTGALHRVASFAGGVTKALGASLKNPTDSGTTTVVSASLWGSGPAVSDANQGSSGDCYFLSSLAAFASFKTSQLQESAVDMGDGTYVVRFFTNGNPVYVRVNKNLSVGNFDGFKFAYPGVNGSIWAMIMEKAFAYFRTGANTYASISSGWMGSVYTALGVTSNTIFTASYNESSFYSLVSAALAADEPVTLGTPANAPNLVGDHAYTLVGASEDLDGTTHYVLRNPWGVSGDSLEDSHGFVTLTFAQLEANCNDGAIATS